jgi:hypothetical protein
MSSYETCHHGKCTTYPGWQKCEKCEAQLERRMWKEQKKKTQLYHLIRYAFRRMNQDGN